MTEHKLCLKCKSGSHCAAVWKHWHYDARPSNFQRNIWNANFCIKSPSEEKKNALKCIQNLSGSCIQVESIELQVLCDSEEHKLASLLKLLPGGGTHEGNSESCVLGDAWVVLSCPNWGIITNGEITRSVAMASWIMGPQWCQHLHPTNETLHGKRVLQMWLSILRWEIILDFPGRPIVITRIFMRERQRMGQSQREERRCDDRWLGQKDAVTRRRPATKEWRWLLEAGKCMKPFLP